MYAMWRDKLVLLTRLAVQRSVLGSTYCPQAQQKNEGRSTAVRIALLSAALLGGQALNRFQISLGSCFGLRHQSELEPKARTPHPF